MPRRFLGIRLLLVFVAINTAMMLILVSSLTATKPWLANVIPGEWGQGHSTGLWVFFSLVLLVNALAILLAGLVMVIPTLRDGERGYQRLAGSLILLLAGVFLVLAFGSVSLSFAKALPDDQMFVVTDSSFGASAGHISNRSVDLPQVQMFTFDQFARATLFDAPAVYGIHMSPLANNPDNRIFTHFTFAFRVAIGVLVLLILISLIGGGHRTESAPPQGEAAA